jgi:hypothetical protein
MYPFEKQHTAPEKRHTAPEKQHTAPEKQHTVPEKKRRRKTETKKILTNHAYVFSGLRLYCFAMNR